MEFTKESNQFFKLFVSKNAQFYYECIIRLIERSKEVPVLYERDAKELIIRCFREFQYDPETDDVEPDEEKSRRIKRVLRRRPQARLLQGSVNAGGWKSGSSGGTEKIRSP